MILAEVGPIAAHGGLRTEQGDNITLLERGTGSTYTLKRLKRDRPDLAERWPCARHSGTLWPTGTEQARRGRQTVSESMRIEDPPVA